MNNYKLTIQYDGTDYAGWQVQKNAKTVQGTISDAIKVILKEEVNLIGSGRTDTGVHALGQIANFRFDNKIDIYRFQHSLNSILPVDISVTDLMEVPESFHSRFDAKSRTYFYVVCKIKSPFYYRYSLFKKGLDVQMLNQLCKNFVGEKDYTSFCKKNSEVNSKICKVSSAEWRETKNFYLFFISADRFLHGMVRTIIGTLFDALVHTKGDDFINNNFNNKDRASAGEAVAAKGLFLFKITY